MTEIFTKEQYTAFLGILSPTDILDYISKHEKEYQEFLEKEAKEDKVEVCK